MFKLASLVIGTSILGIAALGQLASVDVSHSSAVDSRLAATDTLVSVSTPVIDRQRRHPIDLVYSDSIDRLFVLNRSTQSLSRVDVINGVVDAEFRVGVEPTAVVGYDDNHLLVLDAGSHQLRQYRFVEDRLEEAATVTVAKYPMKLVASAELELAVVASRWSRRLSMVSLAAAESDAAPRVVETIDLSFSPHELLFVETGESKTRELLVADAFGGRLAIVDLDSMTVSREFEIPAHNIRGLTLSPDGKRVAVAHQMLNELAHTVRNDVHWGLLMSNDLRWLRLESLRSGSQNVLEQSHMHPLGQAGHAAGDPTDVCLAPVSGNVVVSIGGVDEVAIGQESDFSLERISVGRRPIAVTLSNDESLAYVANMFDDSVSVISVADREVVQTIPLNQGFDESEQELGERLFFDARLSHDGWMSCHSCHTDGHSNGHLNDNLTDDSFGAPKRVLSLLGVADTLPLAWDGSIEQLHEQIAFSVKSTMQGARVPDDRELQAIASYLETLEVPPALNQAREMVDEASFQRGAALFASLNCDACHQPPFYTSPATFDIGLVDEMGRREFNPPSLRGVSQRDKLFHDNRANGLESVLVEFQHRLEQPLEAEELGDLIEFLSGI